MKLVLRIYFLLALFSVGHAADLEMRAIYDHRQLAPPKGTYGNQADFQRVVVWVYFTNLDAAEIRIPTSGFQMVQTSRVDGTGSTFRFISGIQPNPLDLPVIMPESDRGIVTLRKNETTFLRYETTVDIKQDFSRLMIACDIVEEVAKRHNLWSGRLLVEAGPYDHAIPKKN